MQTATMAYMATTESTRDGTAGFDADFIIVGSGFGGSVSALRLAEKGYSVIVIERGKRWRAEDFPKSNWNVFKSMWFPLAWCFGIQRLTLLSDVMVLSGSGVGGGSLVYANTLLVPPKPFFVDEQWREMADWQTELAPHYKTAQRMLGAVPNPVLGPADDVLRAVAEEMGVGDTVNVTDVGVYFGKPGVTQEDPYFDGEGPARTGCVLCGACMTGCKHGAKNTLDKNYLYLAEKRGVEVIPEREALHIACVGGPDAAGKNGYEVTIRRSTSKLWGLLSPKKVLRARRVVLSCGVLGTLPLLMRSAEKGHLTRLPPSLGTRLRTNSEAICGATAKSDAINYSEGVAITSGAYFNEHTHIEVVRYGKGHDALGVLGTVMADGGPGVPRWLKWVAAIARSPMVFIRSLSPFGWAKKTIILLVMQTLDNSLKAVWRRSWLTPWRKTLKTENPSGKSMPTYIPIGNEVARRMAKRIGGNPISSLNEVVLDVPTTAHILGGCVVGPDPEHGTIAANHEVYGYDGLFVCDGSMIPANLGVNPSLTITAMTERAMSLLPARERPSASGE